MKYGITFKDIDYLKGEASYFIAYEDNLDVNPNSGIATFAVRDKFEGNIYIDFETPEEIKKAILELLNCYKNYLDSSHQKTAFIKELLDFINSKNEL